MSKFDSPLNNIRVASPCPADWDQMYGDSRKRFCGECKLNVYNLSGMTRNEAEALIMNADGRLCVRYYKRRDGTVITQDCPVGWAKVKQRARLYATAMFSMLMALFTGVLFASFFARQKATMGDVSVGVLAMPTPTPTHTMGAVSPLMGNVAIQGTMPNRPRSDFEMGRMRVLNDGQHRGPNS